MILKLDNVDVFVCLARALIEPSSPLNYAAVKGETIRLNCTTDNDDTRYWFRSKPLSGDVILIHHNGNLDNRLFSVDESIPGRLDLLFTLRQRTSGRFGCDSGNGNRTAEIILTGQFYEFSTVAVLLINVIEIVTD